MPSAIRHDRELSAKGLVTLLVETGGTKENAMQAFLWRTFPDNHAFACTGVGVPMPPAPGLPHGGVIGVDGTLLWAGNPLSAPKQISELIDAELAKVRKGWGDTADARKVRAALFGRGDLAAAQALVTALADGVERTTLQAEVDHRYATAKQAITNLQEQGRWLAAEDAAKELRKSVGDQATWVAEVDQLLATFATDAGKAELAADKKMAKVEKQLRDKQFEAAEKGLAAIVKTAGETKAGARAAQMLATIPITTF